MITDKSKKVVTLIITQKCNLNCIYCYEEFKSAQTMSLSTAILILNKELELSDGTDFVEINLFGGEPFLAFELIKNITNYLLSHKYSKKWKLSTITNGTLIHGETQEWLLKHIDCFECVLSLDGNPKMQNINRNNSFYKIDINFFKKLYPNMFIKMTVSKETLRDLSSGVIYCHENGLNVANNLAYGIDWNDQDIEILSKELEILIQYYLDNPHIEECSMLHLPYIEMFTYRNHKCRNCNAGTKYLKAYDIDGKEYPCHMFTPLSIGMSTHNNTKEIVFPENEVCTQLLDSKCRNCPIVSFCQFCYGSNYIEYQNIYKINPMICKINKVIFSAKAVLYAKRWQRGQIKVDEGEERALLDSILKLQDF